MNLKKVEPCTSHKNGKSTINISKSGPMTFSKAIVRAMGLKNGMNVSFYQDLDNKIDWYVRVEIEGIPIRMSNITTVCSSASIAKEILDSIGLKRKVNVLVSIEPIEGGYYALITKSAKGE